MTSSTTHRPATATRSSVGVFVVSTIYVFTAAGLIIWVVLPTILLGLRPAVITSGSMTPLIQRGDIVMFQPVTEPGQLEDGAVITFRDVRFDRLVTHRIVEIVDDGYITRGDANPAEDPEIVTFDAVVGRGRLLVPFVGAPLVWLRQGDWGVLLAWLALTVLAVDRSIRVPQVRAEGASDGRPSREDRRLRLAVQKLRRTPRPSTGTSMLQLTILGVMAASVLAVPRTAAALATVAGNLGNGFQIGTWATPEAWYLQPDGTSATTAPAGPAQWERIDPGASRVFPVTTPSADHTFGGDTTVDLFVERQGKKGPRTIHVALRWGTQLVTATLSGSPDKPEELWTFTLPTDGLTVPAGTPIELIVEVDSTSTSGIRLHYGDTTVPTGVTFPGSVS